MIKNLTEYELVQGCKANDRAAQQKVYEMLAPKLIGICERYVGDREEARDIVQDVFFKVFTGIDKFRFQSAFSTWVIRILINESLACLKRKKRWRMVVSLDDLTQAEEPVEELEEDTSPDCLESLNASEIVEQIRTLPEQYRLVLNMYVMEGYSHKEIGEHLDISESASKILLHRSRKKLNARVQDYLKKKLNEKAV